jgi:hypothetical protein
LFLCDWICNIAERTSPPLAQRRRQLTKLLAVKPLGPKLAAVVLRLEPGIDVGLRPCITLDAGQRIPKMLAAM